MASIQLNSFSAARIGQRLEQSSRQLEQASIGAATERSRSMSPSRFLDTAQTQGVVGGRPVNQSSCAKTFDQYRVNPVVSDAICVVVKPFTDTMGRMYRFRMPHIVQDGKATNKSWVGTETGISVGERQNGEQN